MGAARGMHGDVAVAVVYPLTTSGSSKPWADIAQ
jgi:hypothetical protein